MAELYNFSSHLKKIVGPVMKAQGFSAKGTRFLRTADGFSDEIYVQRSQWNMGSWACSLYVNLYSDLGEVSPSRTNLASFVRVSRPAPLEYPEFFRRYLEIPFGTPERARAWASFERQQMDQVVQIMQSRNWVYTSEEGLCQLFEVMAVQLQTVGLEYFEQVHHVLGSNPRPVVAKFSHEWSQAHLDMPGYILE